MSADLEQRGIAFLRALSAAQGIPAEDLANSFRKYNPSVLHWYVTIWEAEGPDGFQDAFQLVDVLEGLGCKDLDFQDPDRTDPVNLGGTGPGGGPFQITLRRAALGLNRGQLTSLVRTNLGLPDEDVMPAPPPRAPAKAAEKVEPPPPAEPAPAPAAAAPAEATTSATKGATRKQTRARPKVPPLKPAKALSGSFPPKPAEAAVAPAAAPAEPPVTAPAPATAAVTAPAAASVAATAPATAPATPPAAPAPAKADPYAAALKGWAARKAAEKPPPPPAAPPPVPPEPVEDDLAPIVLPAAAAQPSPPTPEPAPGPEPEPAPPTEPAPEPVAAALPDPPPEPPAPPEPELAAPSNAPLPSWMDRDSGRNRTGGIPRSQDTTNVLLSGKLKEMSLPDLVQILQFQKKTGVLKILASGPKKVQLGAVWFNKGNVWDSQAGDLMGEDAFYRLALMDDGSFRFGAGAAAKRHITRPTTTLLMEAMRRRDEAGRPSDGETPSEA